MRREGWELRLVAVIEAARQKPYALGTHDCFSFACQAVHALTGIDHWPQWEGRYTTRREALKLLAEYGRTFTDSFTRLFGVEPASMPFAMRGDIAEYVDARGEAHLGVVIGVGVAVLGEAGLMFLPRVACRHAWRIG